MAFIGQSYVVEHLGEEYGDLLEYVKGRGATVDSRYGETKEMLDFRLELLDPRACIVDRLGFSHRFMNAEIDQFIAGVHDGDVLKAVSPQASSMITEKTNYGVRTGSQLATVVDELHENRDSRRAVAYIGYPNDLQELRNNPSGRVERANEIACTCVWQFIIRENQLHMFIYGRSWDLVWGLSYDIPSTVAVQIAVAQALGVETGTYAFHAGSAHIYERHYDLDVMPRSSRLSLPWLVWPGATIRDIQKKAYQRIVDSKDYKGGGEFEDGPRGYYDYVTQ